MGYQVEKKAVYTASGAGFYIGKYLAKQLPDQQWPKGFRRIRTSLHMPKLPPLEKAEGWTFEVVCRGETVVGRANELLAGNFRVAIADNATAWELVDRFSIPA